MLVSGFWHGASWGCIIWGCLHGLALMIYKIYSWFHQSLDKSSRYVAFMQTKFYIFLCWLLTFNFIVVARVFFCTSSIDSALNLIKGMYGIVWIELPEKWHIMPKTLANIGGRNDTLFFIVIALIVCVFAKNSVELTKNFRSNALKFSLSLRLFGRRIYLKCGGVFVKFIVSVGLFLVSVWILFKAMLGSNTYTPFIYVNF